MPQPYPTRDDNRKAGDRWTRHTPLDRRPRRFHAGIMKFLAIAAALLMAVPPMVSADDLIRAVQVKLAHMGHYKGRVDGDAGSMTAAAIRRFQLAEGLKVTGEINRQTLARLGIERNGPTPDYKAINALFDGGPLSRSDAATQVEAIRFVQRLLAERELYAGPHNGLPGAALETAIRDFQRSHGLRPTGRLDQRTLATLGVPPPPRP
jgi:peptidoglycan hydrolase-like protein with peptidoglycan-binding domain